MTRNRVPTELAVEPSQNRYKSILMLASCSLGHFLEGFERSADVIGLLAWFGLKRPTLRKGAGRRLLDREQYRTDP
jgi:hypothetical protein